MFGFIPLARRLTSAIGVDMGTGNTRVHVRGRGIVLNEPTVVAVGTNDRSIRAIGHDAKEMLGRTPEAIEAVRPLRDGAIADASLAEEMLRLFLRRAVKRRIPVARVSVVVSTPTGITDLERRAIESSAIAAGAHRVHMIPEPIAAAIGVGMPVDTPTGHVLVDIGGGTTKIAIIALGGILYGKSIRVGGDALDRSIASYIRKHHGLLIGEASAERVKIQAGAAVRGLVDRTVSVRGRDLVSGLPRSVELTSDDVWEAIQEPVQQIVDAVLRALENSPPELAADIVDRGITLTGGGALLRGLDKLIAQHTSIPVQVADEPLTCVVRGTARVVDEFEHFTWLYA